MKKKIIERISYIEIIFDTRFILLQKELSPILVDPKLGEP